MSQKSKNIKRKYSKVLPTTTETPFSLPTQQVKKTERSSSRQKTKIQNKSPPPSNQKKKMEIKKKNQEEVGQDTPNQNHYVKYSDRLLDKYDPTGYLKTIIFAGSDIYHCECGICEEDFLVSYTLGHIGTEKHSDHTKKKFPNHLPKLENLLEIIKEEEKDREKEKEKGILNPCLSLEDEENRVYLEFLAFCLAERMSFASIERMGTFLKELLKRRNKIGLNFFARKSFDEEIVGKVTVGCFRPVLVKELEKNLANNKFSFSIDTATISGQNICAMRTRFLGTEFDESYDSNITAIKNKVIGIFPLKESSTAQTLYDIVNEKIFLNEESIKRNLIGWTHDRASALSGNDNGLKALLEKGVKQKILDLPDPCHSLSLIIRHSLSSLPDNILKFVNDVNNYFNSPQRKEKLKELQLKEENSVLLPKQYVKTRWLSLGESLERLIEIWPSLIVYMDTMNKKKGSRQNKKVLEDLIQNDTEISQVNYEEVSLLLHDESFKAQMIFLEIIMSQLNIFSKVFQNQSLPISELKSKSQEIFTYILSLAVNSKKLDLQNIEPYTKKNWKSLENQQEWFYTDLDFVSSLLRTYPSLENLKKLPQKELESFCSNAKKYIGDLLDLMIDYLPLQHSIINTLDFIEDFSTFHSFEQKVLDFNEYFGIISKENLPALRGEIMKLTSRKRTLYTENSKNILHTWDRIEKDHLSDGSTFVHLPKLAKAAQALPTSSSDVEQSFSGIKLIKTLLRNQLSSEALEAIVLIVQEFKDQEIVITNEMIQLYKNVKNSINQRKSQKNGSQVVIEEEEKTKVEEPSEKELIRSQEITDAAQICSSSQKREIEERMEIEISQTRVNFFVKASEEPDADHDEIKRLQDFI